MKSRTSSTQMGVSQSQMQPMQETPWQSDYYASGKTKGNNCDWKKCTFYVSLCPASLIICWFYSVRNLELLFPSAELATGIAQEMINKDQSGGQVTNQYNMINISADINLVHFLLTILIVMCSVALSPGIGGKVCSFFRLFLPICYLGSGLTFLHKLTVVIIWYIQSYSSGPNNPQGQGSSEKSQKVARVFYAIVVLLLALSLLCVALLWLLTSEESEGSEEYNNNNEESIMYEQQAPANPNMFMMAPMPPVAPQRSATALSLKKSRRLRSSHG